MKTAPRRFDLSLQPFALYDFLDVEEQAAKLVLLRGSITTRAGQRMLLIKKGFSEAVYPAVLPFLVTVCANSADLAFSLGAKRGLLAKVNIQV